MINHQERRGYQMINLLEIPIAEKGFTVRVTEITEGYLVTIRDDDAGEVHPFEMIYTDYECAVKCARKFAFIWATWHV
jgi:hypothetical protein